MHTIRLAIPADADAIAPLFDAYRQFYQQPSDLPLARQFIQKRLSKRESVILLAINAAKEIIGFCQMYPSFCSVDAAQIYNLYDLFVLPSARRSGVGQQLLVAAHQNALENGFARMDLTTAKDNHGAQALYESLGWLRDDVFYAYHKPVVAVVA